ncbi:hypothetical protein [Okeania sp. SIO2B3]|uniref:hypothetical protein n=1 Tax=Okeania sp. SIO2B3 TaxID=2607784 RepID=UPI0013C0A497|nr:hypothetical protein [Okeania sp. SIO2B3]NET43632.1 hypothetical protein [Okeania sp. SIO2B3]
MKAENNEVRKEVSKQETTAEEFFQTANHLKIQGKLEAAGTYKGAEELVRSKMTRFFQPSNQRLENLGFKLTKL